MARNAATMGGTTSTDSYQQPQSETVKNPFSTINMSRDPIAAAAAQWASQSSTPKFEPPPSYNSAAAAAPPTRNNWDQSFVNNSSNQSSYGVNPAPSDPHNPFQ